MCYTEQVNRDQVYSKRQLANRTARRSVTVSCTGCGKPRRVDNATPELAWAFEHGRTVYCDACRLNARRDALLKKYGLTAAEYEAKLAKQGGVCAICKRPPKTKRLAVDHNHKTNKVRGLLCYPCNYGLGVLKENRVRLEGMLAYLDMYKDV